MNKKLFLLAVIAIFGYSCSSEIDILNDTDTTRAVVIPGSDILQPIHIGERLENPYSVKNMLKAYANLKDQPIFSGLNESDIKATHYYVRFKPANENELKTLKQDPALVLYEYPLDYDIHEGGESYHDPAIPDSLPTYQYASIPAVLWARKRNTLQIEYTVLENLYIPDEEYIDDIEAYSSEDNANEFAIEALVDEAMRITGNDGDQPVTRASNKWTPAGKITAYDNIVGKSIPLKGVKVRARRWFTTYIGHTDGNGHFMCNGRFKRPANYSIVWESAKWDIRNGRLGQAYFNGPKITGSWQLDIGDGDNKSIHFATIHRALHRYYYGLTYGLSRPNNSRKEKIGYIHENGDVAGIYHRQRNAGILSDSEIYGKSHDSWRPLSEMLSTTFHELGHAAHFTNSKSNFKNADNILCESWARCVQYYLTLQEYTDLGYEKSLYTYSPAYPISDITMRCITVTIMMPDEQYNFQDWYKDKHEHCYDYTPLFIDLLDSYNQFKCMSGLKKYLDDTGTNQSNSIDPSKYPDDQIHDFPIDKLEDIVFSSQTISDVKSKLLQFVIDNPTIAKNCNLSEQTINKLFSYYEY